MLALRQSSLNQYDKCPFSCKAIYGEMGIGQGEIENTQNKYTTIGIILHEVMEIWGIDKKCKIGIDESKYHALIDEKVDNVDITLFEGTEEIENYRISLHEQLDWLLEQSDSNEILEVEFDFELKPKVMFEEITMPVVGQIDRIDGDLSSKRATLIDYKSGRTYTKKSLRTNMQACIYSIAFYNRFGFLPEKFVFYFSKHKKKMIIWITPEFLQEAGAKILSIWYKIENNEYEPNKENKYHCKNFCEVRKICPIYKRNDMPTSWGELLDV